MLDFFGRAARVAKSHGIPASSLCFDPGIGFAKSYEDNLRLIRDIGKIKTDGSALMSAASRKRVIGTASGETDAAKRDPGTVALHTASILNGADVIRAHDVFSAVQSARRRGRTEKRYTGRQTVDKIIIDSLRLFAYHGVNPEEQEDGQFFILDIEADIPLSKSRRERRFK